ncbi:FAD/NAD(P)-binding protein [Patescibacteria group bacterium]|nr:FAD/NAD(P)-binding protein [Patescibacteria group bacterium]
MINLYVPKLAKIINIKQESPDSKLFTLQYQDKSEFEFTHGQFVQIGLFGWGEAPFSLCGPTTEEKTFQIVVREVGDLTKRIQKLTKGQTITVRGPFGNGFPMDKFVNKNVILIGGGCGFVAMRSFVLDHNLGKFNPKNKLQIFYGCLNEESVLFSDELKAWKKKIDYRIALMKPSPKWRGIKGVVTKIFEKVKVVNNAVAVIVGPPIMYKFVIEELTKKGFADTDIYLSLERRMYCGLGVCQHCAIGSYYVCKDGPVFSYSQLKETRGAI